MRSAPYTPRMTRVSPPEEAREFPGPHASSNVTLAPRRRRARAVHPPNAPAPTTITRGFAPARPGAGGGLLERACARRLAAAIPPSPENRDRREIVPPPPGFPMSAGAEHIHIIPA